MNKGPKFYQIEVVGGEGFPANLYHQTDKDGPMTR